MCAESGRFAGVACLGVVIRGETDHYDFVCAEAAAASSDVQLDTGVPCAFGVITCETMEQALARAGGGKRDQGRNAAIAVAADGAVLRGSSCDAASAATIPASWPRSAQLRQGARVRQLAQPLDGRDPAPLRPEPPEGPDRRRRPPRRVYVCTRCLKANKVTKHA